MNSLKKNAGLTLAASCGFLTRAASKTKSLSVRSLSIALIAGLSLLGSEKAIAARSPTPVTIILDNHITSTGTEGPFTASGGLNTSGFNKMVVRAAGNGPWGQTLHCNTVLTDANGSLVQRLGRFTCIAWAVVIGPAVRAAAVHLAGSLAGVASAGFSGGRAVSRLHTSLKS